MGSMRIRIADVTHIAMLRFRVVVGCYVNGMFLWWHFNHLKMTVFFFVLQEMPRAMYREVCGENLWTYFWNSWSKISWRFSQSLNATNFTESDNNSNILFFISVIVYFDQLYDEPWYFKFWKFSNFFAMSNESIEENLETPDKFIKLRYFWWNIFTWIFFFKF